MRRPGVPTASSANSAARPLTVLSTIVTELGEPDAQAGAGPSLCHRALRPLLRQGQGADLLRPLGRFLQLRLMEAAERYGAGQVALEVERVCQDFFLPPQPAQGRGPPRRSCKAPDGGAGPLGFLFKRALRPLLLPYMSPRAGPTSSFSTTRGASAKKLHIARSLDISDGVLTSSPGLRSAE